jgi:hypothetical protein
MTGCHERRLRRRNIRARRNKDDPFGAVRVLQKSPM